jgi:cell wall-associated NlpC family hydrolase
VKDDHNNKLEIKIEGKLETQVPSQGEPSSNIQKPKSGGNTPSDLGAIKKNELPNSASNSKSRSTLNRPTMPSNNTMGNSSSTSSPNRMGGRQQNAGAQIRKQTSSKEVKKTKNQVNKDQVQKKGIVNPKERNPLLNQNKMKDFGKNAKVQIPKINSSASFFSKAKGLFSGKNAMPKLPGIRGFSSTSTKKKKPSATEKLLEKRTNFDLVALFQALPIQVKIAIVGGGLGIFLLIITLIIIITTRTSAADGNREMVNNYLKGDYTNDELCEYLEANDYLIGEDGQNLTCEDHPAYQFFTNFKDVMEEYENKYSTYRFQVNVELLYETLAYYKGDEEFYQQVTREEIENLIDAMLEEVEESCVVKTYDKKKKTCTQNKYVYTLYEFSLNKYISYLKYGTTSTHPNYGNDSSNKSSNGKAVTRICGEGNNVDYVFGFGLVNTSSSPLSESSDCPNNPVTSADYEDNAKGITTVATTLDKLGVLGGVEKYSHVYVEDTTNSNTTSNSNTTTSIKGTDKGSEIAKYALLFVGNPYVFGGNSLTTGTDCSGFVNLVYAHFGYTVARQSSALASAGKKVECTTSSLKPGDLILYGSPVDHVAIYTGNGMIVHAKGASWGITTDKYDYSSKGINTCRRIVSN